MRTPTTPTEEHAPHNRRAEIIRKIADLKQVICALEAELAAMPKSESQMEYLTRVNRQRRKIRPAAFGFANGWK